MLQAVLFEVIEAYFKMEIKKCKSMKVSHTEFQ
jgi:hypothetical protein